MTMLIFALAISLANADNKCDVIAVEKEKLVKFIKEKSNCYIGVGAKWIKDGCVLTDFLCVLNGTIGKNTINPKSGCMFVEFSSTSGTVKGTFQRPFSPNGIAMVDKHCMKGGFQELLKEAAWHGSTDPNVDKGRDVTVAEMLRKGSGSMFQPAILLYKDDKIKDLYNEK